MSIVDLQDLPSIREKHKNQSVAFCSGSFDLTHAGHILFFEDCKKYADILVVMLGNDFNLRNYKGEERPILNQHVRLKTVDSFKPVDYVFLDGNAESGKLLMTIPRAIEKLKPDFYIINEDAFDIEARREFMKPLTAKLIILPRICPPEFENISTTKIIDKIKRLK